jgi:hypothetical protein
VTIYKYLFISIFLIAIVRLNAQEKFELEDIFALQYANDIQISPDGKQIVYRKMGYDIMSDKNVGNLWILNTDGSGHQKLTIQDGLLVGIELPL